MKSTTSDNSLQIGFRRPRAILVEAEATERAEMNATHPRRAIKLTMSIVAISYFLIALDALPNTMDLAPSEQQTQHAQLGNMQPCAPEFADSLRSTTTNSATRVSARVEELHGKIRELNVAQARELAAFKAETEGSSSGIGKGIGPKARGHSAAAARFAQEIATAQSELAELSNAESRRCRAHNSW